MGEQARVGLPRSAYALVGRVVSGREVLNVDQAAEFLGFSAYTVREKARSGEIPGRKVGREWRFSRDQLLGWLGAPREPDAREDLLDLCKKTYAVCDAVYEGRSVNLFTFTDELDRLAAKYGSARHEGAV